MVESISQNFNNKISFQLYHIILYNILYCHITIHKMHSNNSGTCLRIRPELTRKIFVPSKLTVFQTVQADHLRTLPETLIVQGVA